MLDQILVIVSVTALVMVTPGPDMVLVLRNTFAGGRGAGLQTSVGIAVDRPLIRNSIERSQQTVNRIFGALLLLLGIRVASMSR